MEEKTLMSHPYQRVNAHYFYMLKAVEVALLIIFGWAIGRGTADFETCLLGIAFEIFFLYNLHTFFHRNSFRLTLESTGIRIMNDKDGDVFFKWQDIPNSYFTHTKIGIGVVYIVLTNAVYTDKELVKLCTKAQPKQKMVYYDHDHVTVVFDPRDFQQPYKEVKKFVLQHSIVNMGPPLF